MKNVRVLIVDDSILIRKMLKEIFDSEPGFEVVGVASDPYIARDKIKQVHPDVLTLDVEMPRMDGLQFLSNLMRLHPMPVVMVSTLTEAGAPETLEALEIGAVDYIAKPQAHNMSAFETFASSLCEKVKMASSAKVQSKDTRRQLPCRIVNHRAASTFRRFVCIGSSTGGTEAINELLLTLPADCPPIVITQHIPAVFSASLATRLNNRHPMEVMEARQDLEVCAGRVIIAKGDHHLTFRKQGDRIFCHLVQSDPVNLHRPSVEVMFDSMKEIMGGHKLVTVMLTGMGADGAVAMKRLHNDGAVTCAQDEHTSVVWGMPKAVVDLGAADSVLPITAIGDKVMQYAMRA